jgi:hypothetical protein
VSDLKLPSSGLPLSRALPLSKELPLSTLSSLGELLQPKTMPAAPATTTLLKSAHDDSISKLHTRVVFLDPSCNGWRAGMNRSSSAPRRERFVRW